MEEVKEMMKHLCKFCNKSFPCGRSLGGHMRSHLININQADLHHNKKKKVSKKKFSPDDGPIENNRKKTSKFFAKNSNSNEDDDDQSSIDFKVCKECGKGFQSWKALFGHMKCHSDKVSSSKNNNNNISTILQQRDDDSWNISSNDQTEASIPIQKKQRSGSIKRYNKSSPCASEIEQEEVAMSLILLSRHHVESEFNNSKCSKNGQRNDSSKRKCSDLREEEPESSMDYSSMKRKFECTCCNKIFHSYQALGGHRASHKKMKGCCFTSKFDSSENSTETAISPRKVIKKECYINDNCTLGEKDYHHMIKEDINIDYGSKRNNTTKGHECPICFKVFQSGQALGGHKRSHLMAEAKSNKENNNTTTAAAAMVVIEKKKDPEIREFLDLNLPAPPEDDDDQGYFSSSWWMMGSNLKHEHLVGPL